MAQNLRVDESRHQSEEPSVGRLLGDIVADAQKLVRQEIALARVELGQEVQKAKAATLAYATAVALSMVTAFTLSLSVAQILIALGVVPWLSYLLVTALLGTITWVMVQRGIASVKQISFVPRQTVETMRENVKWMRNPT